MLRSRIYWFALVAVVAVPHVRGQQPMAEVDECKAQLTNADARSRLVAVIRLGGIAATARTEIPTKNDATDVLRALRRLGPDIAKLRNDPDLRICAAVIDTLAKVRADGDVFGPVLMAALTGTDEAMRRLAVESIATYSRRTAADIKGAEAKDKDANDPVADDVTRYALKAEVLVELAKDGQQLIPVLELALRSRDASVRVRALDALTDVTLAFTLETKPGPQRDNLGDVNAPAIAAELTRLKNELLKLAEKVQDLQPALSVILEQGDATPSEKAAFAFERLIIFESWFHRPELQPQGDAAAEVVAKAILAGIPALTIGLRHQSVDVRIAAANALDTLGPAVAPAATQLVAALRDCNLFVRWITARSLSNIGPGKLPPALEETIVLALGEATRCGDEDARRVALKALERFGAKAVPAIPLLGPAIENDNAEVQTQALKALDVIGPAGKAALPFLLKALQSPEARVRRQVPAIIAKYGPDAKSAIPALEVALFDSDEIVRQEAAKALLKLQK